MKSILINIEGTDCSGKNTQTEMLIKKLTAKGLKVKKMSFPMYDTPTGKIVGGPYLGRKSISNGYFKEGASNVEAKVASLYFAADRYYNKNIINEYLKENDIVVLDRYVDSNMAHQGCKLNSKEEREDMFEWLYNLEYGLLELPKPDLTIFLYMPYEYSNILKSNREEIDEHESSEEHLRRAEKTYLELANKYKYNIINCVEDNKIKTVDNINKEIISIINKNRV